MELAVVERDLAFICNDDAGVIRIAGRVLLHQREAAPDRVVDAGLAERRDLRPVERAHDRRVGVHREAVQRVFREHHEVHGRHVAPRLCHHGDDGFRLSGEVGGRRDHRQLQLHQADDDAVGRLVETA
jgi:aromatic ring-cleaving dioxygenase